MQKIGFFLAIIGIFIFGCLIQSTLLINWDVSWDLLATQRLLVGGSYTKDYFDMNPPLIFYLYVPSILLAKMFSISVMLALRIHMFLLAWISLGLSAIFLRKIFNKSDDFFAKSFLIMTAIAFFILTFNELGEREYIMVVLTVPYFLLLASRLQGQSINPFLALSIGVYSGLGFLIKPYFLIAPVLLEFYYLWVTRRWLGWLRVEVVTLFLLFVGYLFFIYQFHQDYISTVLPISFRYYYASMRSTWLEVIVEPMIVYCYLIMIAYGFFYRRVRHKTFCSILLVGVMSFTLVYWLQKTNWSYHLYPALVYAMLLATMLFCRLIQATNGILTWIASAVALFSFPLYYAYDGLYLYGISYKFEHAKLIQLMRAHAEHKFVYSLSADTQMFPAINYAGVHYSSRFMHLFWMPAIAKSSRMTEQRRQDEKMLMGWIVEEMNRDKPTLIFVDVRQYKSFFSLRMFDYLEYFLKDPAFKKAFQPYHYLTTIEQFPLRSSGIEEWSLYGFPKKEMVEIDKIKNRSVILIGEGNQRKAYFIQDKKFLEYNGEILWVLVTLSPEEQLFFSMPGEIVMNAQNAGILLDVIKRSVKFPVYRLDVYKRA